MEHYDYEICNVNTPVDATGYILRAPSCPYSLLLYSMVSPYGYCYSPDSGIPFISISHLHSFLCTYTLVHGYLLQLISSFIILFLLRFSSFLTCFMIYNSHLHTKGCSLPPSLLFQTYNSLTFIRLKVHFSFQMLLLALDTSNFIFHQLHQ